MGPIRPLRGYSIPGPRHQWPVVTPLAVKTQKHPYSTPVALLFGQEVPQLRTAARGLAAEALAPPCTLERPMPLSLDTSLLVFAALLR